VIGQEVRIFSGPASGKAGIVTAISEMQHTFPSGISGDTASVYLEDDQEVLVPSKNLMILNRGIRAG
jgi:ribosomal protein L24